MNNKFIRFLLIAGSIVILINFSIQIYLLRLAYDEQEKKFSQSVHIALLEVVSKIYNGSLNRMPQNNPIKKVSGDYYVVEINDHINASVLEYYLKSIFGQYGIITDFEYGIYNCYNDEMVYGNYVSMESDAKSVETENYLPKYPDLVYYFGIRFPKHRNFVIGTLYIWLILSSISLIILIFFLYAMIIVLRQKRFSEMQRDFINNMTHEFKTPITASKIAVETIELQPVIKENPSINKYCQIIDIQLDHLNNQIEKILQVSIAEKNTFPIDIKALDIISLIHKVVSVFKSHERNPVIEISTPSSELIVKADEIHLTNILYSLIDNAIKYSNHQPFINIEIHCKDKRIVLSIKDKGIGIDKKFQKKVFQKFYRVPSENLYRTKGFGIGLFYVKKICDKHGWKLLLDSIPGEGTIISIIFQKRDSICING
jgi:two-component system, OmpR family, phosphate regulon sensor histidine kinase PhoR